MAEKTQFNPHGIDASRDYPRSPARLDVPMWNENCLFHGFDPERRVLFYHHHGRLASDPTLWCGDFWLALPDGRLFISKTYGKNELLRGMSDGTLRFECIEPLRSWRITFQGAAFLTTQEDNRKRFASVDLIPVPVEFDVIWEGIAPFVKLDLGNIADNTIPADKEHYEQGGVFRGHFRILDEKFPISGAGYRDHSVGPRDGSKGAFSHVWANATFPKSGRVFGIAGLNDEADHAYVVIDGKHHEAEAIKVPIWAKGKRDFTDKSLTIQLSADGKHVAITGEVIPISFYWTLIDPAQFCPGRNPERELAERRWVVLETAVKYTWDDDVTYGLLEISRRQEGDDSSSS